MFPRGRENTKKKKERCRETLSTGKIRLEKQDNRPSTGSRGVRNRVQTPQLQYKFKVDVGPAFHSSSY